MGALLNDSVVRCIDMRRLLCVNCECVAMFRSQALLHYVAVVVALLISVNRGFIVVLQMLSSYRSVRLPVNTREIAPQKCNV
jgi:hypothetical protein